MTTSDPVKAVMPAPDSHQRAPHTADEPCLMVPDPAVTQTWDNELAQRLIEAGEAMGVDKYDPVVAMAVMALDPVVDERIRFNCHKEVAKYVRLKRQVEPVINQTLNVYNMPAEQRRARITELTDALAQATTVTDLEPIDV